MTLFFALLAAAGLSLQPPPQGVLYDVQYDTGRVYEGTARIAVAPDGAVTGELTIESPFRITGEVRGSVAGGRLTFDHPYTLGDCTGRMHGAGDVSRLAG
jgi:hypothetical protein